MKVVVAGLLVAIATMAMLPTRAVDPASHAAPVTRYADAVARIERQQSVDARVAAVGGGTLFMTHGRRTARVVVLFHGFTDSPRQFVHVAARLFETGDNVYVPRLPHHAERNGTIGSLARLTAEELASFADSSIDIAGGLGDSVIAAGVSAGGTIAAWIAERRSDVQRVVVIAPVLEIGRVPSFLETPLMNVGLRLPNVNRSEGRDPARPDRDPGVSTRAVAQLLRLGHAVRELAQKTPPRAREIIFVVNANDHTVKTAPVLELARAWSASHTPVTVYQFPRKLNLPHDIAEAAHENADTTVVYPVLRALINGQRPLPVLAARRLWPR
ncbi:MAG: alpha/beta hydrolase [Gemmatimonadaceae bacterium]